MLCFLTTKNKIYNIFQSLFKASVSFISEQPSYVYIHVYEAKKISIGQFDSIFIRIQRFLQWLLLKSNTCTEPSDL